MTYIDGFVAAAPSGKQEEYRAYSEKMSRFFKKHGATRVTECWGDDVPDGKLTSFPMAVKRRLTKRSCSRGSSGRRSRCAMKPGAR